MPDPSTKCASDDLATVSIPEIEETAKVRKRDVVTDKVVVRTLVDVERRFLSESLSQESVDVERVAINRVVDFAPKIRTEGEVTIIPILQERLAVEKQLVLLEEVRITRRKSAENVEVPVELRTQRVIVERSQ